ncbi:hypothetical protein Pcac1_g20663 [Phytophthora cactorum]|nr:hypothetical protein Pcac1_g20663 [Phytophthora cactorum]
MEGDTCERSSTPLNGAIFDRERLQQLDDFGAVLPLPTGVLLDSALPLASYDPSLYAEGVACPNLTNNGARVIQMSSDGSLRSMRQLAVDTSLQQLVDTQRRWRSERLVMESLQRGDSAWCEFGGKLVYEEGGVGFSTTLSLLSHIA